MNVGLNNDDSITVATSITTIDGGEATINVSNTSGRNNTTSIDETNINATNIDGCEAPINAGSINVSHNNACSIVASILATSKLVS